MPKLFDLEPGQRFKYTFPAKDIWSTGFMKTGKFVKLTQNRYSKKPCAKIKPDSATSHEFWDNVEVEVIDE